MDLTPRLLEQYLAVAEELHFGRAAQRLSISQPPLSQAIGRLERGIGVALLDRSNKKVRLTAAGAAFAQDAARLLSAQHAAVDRARRIGLGQAGDLRIGSGTMLSFRYFPDLLAATAEHLPDLHLHTRQEPSARDLIELVQADALDIAFVVAPAPDTSGLEVITVHTETLRAAIPATHRLAGATSITLADLRDDNFALPSENVHELGHQIQLACRQAGFTPRDYARSDNSIGLLSYIAAGLCVSLIPPTPYPGVTYLPLDNPPSAAEITVLAVHRANPDPAIRQLLTLIHARQGNPGRDR
ncbi:LysR substrate-binding domain-containing protein [Nocardia transvalensis]|uniref:LysR substrate-binding domain-containing protein n=1 Tax=Nocardia transvalensis TaxID=37333 RepID=UPI00189347F4|nr:LysR substrate-binding domain-containing protein [Nocardia transvalensis]MBF6330273.1 LysR family transcriptional regulator [Nocardia transvalensis]